MESNDSFFYTLKRCNNYLVNKLCLNDLELNYNQDTNRMLVNCWSHCGSEENVLESPLLSEFN